MKPFNGVILTAENGEPILILESQRYSRRVLKRMIKADFNYYNNRESYGAVKLKCYTTKGEIND